MIHVCFSLCDKTGHYSKFTGTAMLSIFENTDSEVMIHILHDNTLTDVGKEKFSYVAEQYNQQVRFYNVGELCADKISEIISSLSSTFRSRFTPAAMYRILIPQILSAKIDKVIYLDSDIIVNLDIKELWQIELGDKAMGVIPVLAISPDIEIIDKIFHDGLVKGEDYFNSGVLFMNLKVLRGEEKTFMDGVKFIIKNKYHKFFDQALLNYCFSTRTVKLPSKYNQYIRQARAKKESVTSKIYHYTSDTLQLKTSDVFNELWMSYFIKSPWFSASTIGNLYKEIKRLDKDLKSEMIKLSTLLSGKTRAFIISPAFVGKAKKIFSIRADEEIIVFKRGDSLPKLIETIKASQNQKLFFIMVPHLPDELEDAGLSHRKDFFNGFVLFAPRWLGFNNAHPFVQAM